MLVLCQKITTINLRKIKVKHDMNHCFGFLSIQEMKKEQMVTHDSAAPDLGIVKPITIPPNKRSKVTYMYISYIYK